MMIVHIIIHKIYNSLSDKFEINNNLISEQINKIFILSITTFLNLVISIKEKNKGNKKISMQ